MKIAVDISSERIASLMVSAIESGDPVTTAEKGGWCSSIMLIEGTGLADSLWYANPELYERPFVIEITEVDDEKTGHTVKHRVDPAKMAAGLSVMADRFGAQFGEILTDQADAATADIFLQSILFGEERYA